MVEPDRPVDKPSDSAERYIGNGVYITYLYGDYGQRVGLIERHPRPGSDEMCQGGVHFDIPENEYIPSNHRWQVESWEPLTLSPSLLCGRCGNHGWIREGKWEFA